MRKSISFLIYFSLLSCFSQNLYSQSAENELDQVKLVQQMIGTWETSIGEDSIAQLTCTPSGEGILCQLKWKSNDEVYEESAAVIGFSVDHKTIFLTIVSNDGYTAQDIGRFVTEKKWVAERFLSDSPTHAIALVEYEFPKPNTYTFTIYVRGMNITWEPMVENKRSFNKID